MYCSKCGTEIPDTATFCFHCGHKIVDPDRVLKSHKNSNILFGVTIAVVVLGVIALFFLLRNHQEEMAKIANQNATKPSPAPSATLTPSPSPSPSPSPTPLTDIRTINFKKMSYRLGDATIKGGDNSVQVVYGDLNGDGIEEAAVSLNYTTGGNGAYSKGFVYGIKEGKLQRMAEFEGGAKDTGAIISARIADGKLEVDRCITDESDNNSLNIETTVYQYADNRLSPLDKKKKKTNSCQ